MTRRQKYLMEVAKKVSSLNPKADMSFEVFPYEGDYALSMTGKVEGRSIKLPFDWKYSKKDGGTVVGPGFLFKYEKHWKYKLNLV